RLTAAVERSALARHEARVGATEEVLVEGPSKTDAAVWSGRTRHNKLLHFTPTADTAPGELVGARVTSAAPHWLRGEVVTRVRPARRRALLVGGTGLYVRAVVDDLAIPPTDAAVRAAIDAEAERDLAALYERLTQLDPDAAARMEPGNRRRIVRALEVIELTGRPFSSFGPGIDDYGRPAIDVTLLGLAVEPADLARRIEQRFAAMRAAGLVDEVRALA